MKTLSPEDKARHNEIMKNRAENSAENSAAIGAIKHVSDRVKANNIALKQFYRDCKMVDSLPIDEELKKAIACQLISAIRDCFKSLEESI